MSAYPTSFPLDKGLEVISIIRSGKVAEKKAVLAYDLWLLQGFVQKTVLGDPDAPAPAPATGGTTSTGGVNSPDINIFSLQDPVAVLEKVCETHQSGAVEAQLQVPWKDILKWALEELVKVVATAA